MNNQKSLLLKLLCALSIMMVFVGSVHAETSDVPDTYTLKEVVVLSRHGIRSPLSNPGSPLDKSTPHDWYEWSSDVSELSLRGGMLETKMGQYFRKWVTSEGLLPENYRSESDDIRFYANAIQRTIATANYFSSGFLPVADIPIEINSPYGETDTNFIPELKYLSEDLAKDAEAQMKEKIPDLTENYELLMDVLDYKESDGYKSGELKELVKGDDTFKLEVGKEPATSGSLRSATSLCDALVLQYYEEADPKKAAFDHDLTSEQWTKISHIKEVYNNVLFGTPLLAPILANDTLKVIQSELSEKDRKFTFLCGHDSTLGSVLASLHAEPYTLPDSIEENVPIGAKLVFEKWADQGGKEFYRIRMVYQSTDQLRSLSILSLDNPPKDYVLAFEGLKANQDGLYPAEDFRKLLQSSIDRFDEIRKEYNIEPAAIPDTGVR